MLERFADNFAALSQDGAHHVAEALATRHRLPEVPDAPHGLVLLRFCEEVGLDQASVVLSLARDTTPLGVRCIEALVGRPITRQMEAPPPKVPARGAAVRKSDNRVVTALAPNPKKPGSLAHARYEAWRVGETVDAAMARGLRREDLRHDLQHGYVVLQGG